MAKQSGLGDNFYIAGYDLSGDIASLSDIAGGPAILPNTGIDKSAMERMGGLRDGRMSFTSYFNPSANQEHSQFKALPVADVIMSYFRGTVLGTEAACLNAKQINYDGKRGDDGSFVFDVDGQGNAYGLEWGKQLTAGKRTDGAATNGTGVDFGAATAFGLQAYLQVFAFTGTSVTVKLQESSDDGVGDPYADVVGGAFTAATGITSQRIETTRSLTVKRYLRVVTTGVFSNAVFAVMVAKNDVAVVF